MGSGSSIGYLNKLFRWLLLGQPSQRQFGNVVREFDPLFQHRRDPLSCVVRFTPKADMCSAQAHVCFGPIADIATLVDRINSLDIRTSSSRILSQPS